MTGTNMCISSAPLATAGRRQRTFICGGAAAGLFHVLFHQRDKRCGSSECGGYAYSRDGLNWVYTGSEAGPGAYGPIVHLAGSGGGAHRAVKG